MKAMGTYATRIFYIYTIMMLLVFVAQLLLYETSLKVWLYPIFTFLISFLLFFVAPAVVIDGARTVDAISKSRRMARKKPGFVIAWSVIGLVMLSVLEILFDLILPHSIAPFAVLFFNSLFVLPYLIVLQTQMYMEKYPLAR
jgi:hypothetical protein